LRKKGGEKRAELAAFPSGPTRPGSPARRKRKGSEKKEKKGGGPSFAGCHLLLHLLYQFEGRNNRGGFRGEKKKGEGKRAGLPVLLSFYSCPRPSGPRRKKEKKKKKEVHKKTARGPGGGGTEKTPPPTSSSTFRFIPDRN